MSLELKSPSGVDELTVRKIIKSKNFRLFEHLNKGDACFMLAIRGYFEDMGQDDVNDRGLYDDVICLVTPDYFKAFTANTDPSGYRKGVGTGDRKGMAFLKNGIWRYQKGKHRNAYWAFRQARRATVIRDGVYGDYEDKGWFGINIHRGGVTTTGSAGCQTIHPKQWLEFKKTFYSELTKYRQETFPYILIDLKEYKDFLGEIELPVKEPKNIRVTGVNEDGFSVEEF